MGYCTISDVKLVTVMLNLIHDRQCGTKTLQNRNCHIYTEMVSIIGPAYYEVTVYCTTNDFNVLYEHNYCTKTVLSEFFDSWHYNNTHSNDNYNSTISTNKQNGDLKQLSGNAEVCIQNT